LLDVLQVLANKGIANVQKSLESSVEQLQINKEFG